MTKLLQCLRDELVRRDPGAILAILPRSLQRPVAVTEGSPIENFNKTGVRLWTATPWRVPGQIALPPLEH